MHNNVSQNENRISSIKTLLSNTEDTIPDRINFIKILLNNNELHPLVDFDDTTTENFTNKDDDSGGSCDTRYALHKKVLDLTNIISNIGGKLKYIKSGTTGHTFKGSYIEEKEITNSVGDTNVVKKVIFEYGVKVVAYSIKEKYGDYHDIRRPENAELAMLKLLSYFIVKKKTPHIILPIATFDTNIAHFTSLIDDDIIDSSNEKYYEFVKKYKRGEYYDTVSVLISEWANRGDFLDFVKKNIKVSHYCIGKYFFSKLSQLLL